MRARALSLLLSLFALLLPFALLTWDGRSVKLESQESKTISGGPVFNEIRWIHEPGRDIWMMNQSHHGALAPKEKWDRLAIVVDNTKSPKRARFYQLESGPLEWKDGGKEKPLRVACFLCHNNGPRAIRPNFDSPAVKVSWKDRARIMIWNLRIKAYGRIQAEPSREQEGPSHPLRFSGRFENEELTVATCVRCHSETGFLARGALHRQQFLSIRFMLRSGNMPPPGFSLTEKERREVERFANGF